MLRTRAPIFATCWLLAVVATPSGGQIPPQDEPEALALVSYPLEHRDVDEALEAVEPLLSARGTARPLPGGRTLEVRDTAARLERVMAMLRRFDRPVDGYEMEFMVIRAQPLSVSPPPPVPKEIPKELLQRWRNLLRYEHYELVARKTWSAQADREVRQDLGGGYQVSFRLSKIYGSRRVKLQNFRLLRRSGKGEEELIHTNLNPRVDQILSLGLAKDEASRTALMVVVVCREGS